MFPKLFFLDKYSILFAAIELEQYWLKYGSVSIDLVSNCTRLRYFSCDLEGKQNKYMIFKHFLSSIRSYIRGSVTQKDQIFLLCNIRHL